MKINELIETLLEIKSEHGDLEIFINQDGFGGHALYNTSEKISISKIGLQDFLFADEPNEESIKKIFPEWDGGFDSEQQIEIKYIELSTGFMIYAS